MDTLIL